MPVELATWIVRFAVVWLAAGLLVGVPFVIRGVSRVDPAAQGATWGFRLLILPGVIVLWPLVLWRWLGNVPPPRERSPHRAEP